MKKSINLASPPEEEENEILKLAKAGNRKAREKIQTLHQGFVASVAKKFQVKQVEFEELMQQGRIGLNSAIDYFEIGRCKFLTYAVWHIRAAITEFLMSLGVIRIPANLHLAINRYIKQYGHPDFQGAQYVKDVEAFCKKAKINKSRFMMAFFASFPISTSVKIMDTKHEWESLLGHSATPLKKMEHVDLQQVLQNTLDHYLTERERKCVALLFGLNETKVHTLLEVSELIGLTKERVRQIRVIALRKMKNALKVQRENSLSPIMG